MKRFVSANRFFYGRGAVAAPGYLEYDDVSGNPTQTGDHPA
jgi:hypothetical protein